MLFLDKPRDNKFWEDPYHIKLITNAHDEKQWSCKYMKTTTNDAPS